MMMDSARILVCVGPGGVGKTTVAAAFAVGAAIRGRRALVLTIDPARRLATALGQGEAHLVRWRVPPQHFSATGLVVAGSLDAEMLEASAVLEELLDRYAFDAATRARVRGNPLYRHLAGALAGMHNYMAVEKLHGSLVANDHDLIVVDTPPSQNAIEFLLAPERLLDALRSPLFRALPRLVRRRGRGAGNVILGRLAELTGRDIFVALGALVEDLASMLSGFEARAAAVSAALRRRDSFIVGVTSPSLLAMEETRFLAERLSAAGLPLAGVVVNGTTPDHGPFPGVDEAVRGLSAWAALADVRREEILAFADALCRAAAASSGDVAAERALMADFAPGAGGFRAVLPRLPFDVHDLGALAVLAERLDGAS
jgi:anion-transporting  ArsA/GET3 family ATPase